MGEERVGPGSRWVLKECELGVSALAMHLEPAAGERDKEELRRDLREIHRTAAAVLQEHGFSQPTVVVTGEPVGDLDLRVEDTAAGTWVLPAGSTEKPESLLGTLTSPDLPKPQIEVEGHDDIVRMLQEVETAPGLLREWIRAVAVGPDPYLTARRRGGEVNRQEYVQQEYQRLRDALRRLLDGEQAWTDLGASSSTNEGEGARLQRRRLQRVDIWDLGGVPYLGLDLSANITLIYGPNGTGKTTLTRALALALCGHTMENLLPRYGQETGRVTVAWKGGSAQTESQVAVYDGEPPRFEGDWNPATHPQSTLLPDAAWKLTVLSDEHVNRVLEVGLEAPSLAVLVPTSVFGDGLDQLLAEELTPDHPRSVLREATIRLQLEEQEAAALDSVRQEIEDRSRPLVDLLGRLFEQHRGLGGDQRAVRAMQCLGRLEVDTQDEQDELDKQDLRNLQAFLRSLLNLRRADYRGEVSLERLASMDAELEALKRRFAAPHEVLTTLSVDGLAFDRMVEGLAELRVRLEQERERFVGEALEPVVQELERVDLGTIRRLADTVRALLGEAREVDRQLRHLEADREVLVAALTEEGVVRDVAKVLHGLNNWIAIEVDAWLKARRRWRRAAVAASRQERRQQQQAAIEVLRDGLQQVQKALHGLRMSQGESGGVLTAMQAVFEAYARRHPSLARLQHRSEGRLIELGRDEWGGIVLKVAGHDTKTLSTGQRHQLALAWVVAQRQVFDRSTRRDELGHRALILDDLASSHDRESVGREAVLLRQLAYSSEEEERTQLIILLHDEELALRYLRVLAPPQGCTMRYVELRPIVEREVVKVVKVEAVEYEVTADPVRPPDPPRSPTPARSSDLARRLVSDVLESLCSELRFGRPPSSDKGASP